MKPQRDDLVKILISTGAFFPFMANLEKMKGVTFEQWVAQRQLNIGTIRYAFKWRQSPQGFRYWYDVNRKWTNIFVKLNKKK